MKLAKCSAQDNTITSIVKSTSISHVSSSINLRNKPMLRREKGSQQFHILLAYAYANFTGPAFLMYLHHYHLLRKRMQVSDQI